MTPEILGRFEFATPWLLLAAPAALLLLLSAHWRSRGRGRSRVRFSSVEGALGLPASWRTRLAWLPGALVALGLLLGAVALARPRLGDERTIVRSEGIAIALVVDRSGSMNAHDFADAAGRPTDRLSAVKSVVREFVGGRDDLPGRGGDTISLAVFAGYADAVCPPTLDHRMLLETLDAVETASARYEDGTSIGQGLAVALGRLRDSPAKSRVVILLTDGMNNDTENDPMAAARVARDLGVRVYTIAMGQNGLAPFPQIDAQGGRHWVQMRTEVDETLLTQIAETTGGAFLRAGTTEGLRDVYARIDRLERTELEGLTYRSYRELYAWPLAAAGLLWVLSLLLEATALRRLGVGGACGAGLPGGGA